ncbi:hypothetical protein DUZ99_10430 [Xylanibacillus composti]|nr:hypothetical protein [Xylanibacillus composti]
MSREEFGYAAAGIANRLKEERWLTLTGLLGFALAAFCAGWMLFKGGYVAPDGDVSKALSFNAALGLFLLSTALLVPFAAMGKKSRVFFRWSYIVLALYAYFAETVQHMRGVNPRFVKDGTPFDYIIGALFAIDAVLLVVCYMFFAAYFFRKKAYVKHPELVAAIRYAMIGVMLSFAAGIWISVLQSRFTGSEGNVIWLHGFGFHALQALPLAAWLLRQKWNAGIWRRGVLHITGCAYILGLIAIGWQTWLGRSVFEWDVLPILACGCFLLALAPGALLFRQTTSAAARRMGIDQAS